jgi:hypothetical protein
VAQLTQIIQIARLALALLPLLIEAIKAVEEALPGQGQGEAKLAMVRGVLQTAYQTGTDLTVSFEQVWPALSASATAVVAAYNKTGAFAK